MNVENKLTIVNPDKSINDDINNIGFFHSSIQKIIQM